MNSVHTAKAELRVRLVIKTKCFSTIEYHLLASKQKNKTPPQAALTGYLPAIFSTISCTSNFDKIHNVQTPFLFILALSKLMMRCQNVYDLSVKGAHPPK